MKNDVNHTIESKLSKTVNNQEYIIRKNIYIFTIKEYDIYFIY